MEVLLSRTNVKRPRASYHTDLKLLASSGLLPNNYASQIHRSVIWKWRQEKAEKYIGHELSQLSASQIENIKSFASDQNAQKVFEAYQKLNALALKLVATKTKVRRIWNSHKCVIIDTIEEVSETIGLKKALACFQISKSTYHNWYQQIKRRCRNSTIGQCLRLHPNQLTNSEVNTMKRLLLAQEYAPWPIASIAYKALRDKLVGASLSTWYKYAKLLGVTRVRPKYKEMKKVGIISTAPNEYWQVDVTILKLENGTKAYLHLLIDNYSRCILSWKLSLNIAAQNILDIVQEAIQNVRNAQPPIHFVSDGGSESNNHLIQDYLKDKQIRKLVALKDFPFSNSAIEAVNKIIKAYLAGRAFYSFQALNQATADLIHNYNTIRPHISLKGLTPSESYHLQTTQIQHNKEFTVVSRANRVAINRTNACSLCIN